MSSLSNPLTNVPESPPVDAVGVEERAARFRSRSVKTEAKTSALRLALSLLDLTTLEGKDSPGKVEQLCRKAACPDPSRPGLPHAAAVCVYPNLVAVASRALVGTGVRVASVATAFPSGMSRLETRLDEVRYAVGEGADEVDMVISRGRFLCGEDSAVFDEVAAAVEACGGRAHLKVILETGELETYDNIRRASDIAMAAGADFIKTSTGKVSPAATMGSTLVMLQAIRDFFARTGRRVGMKPAGGIRDSKTAVHYLVMLRETLGPEWMVPELFRFGASSLANDLLMQLAKRETGAYASPDDFPVG